MKENSDLHAVVLAGPGHRLYPLVDESSPAPTPKSLLPVTNRPMICWTIDWLLASGISTITVVTDNRSSSKLNHILNKYFAEAPATLDMLITDEHTGTVAALVEVGERLPKGDYNILMVPCDLCTNWEGLLSAMADRHRVSKAMLTALLVPESLAVGMTPSPSADDADRESDDKGDSIIVAMRSNCNQLVYYATKTDVEADGVVPINTSTMLKHPNLSLRMDLVDVHCYIISKLLLSHAVFSNSKIFSFREEALPRIVKSSPEYLIQAHLICPAAKVNESQYCLRANTICSYLIANKTLAKYHAGPRVPPTTDLPPKSQVGSDSLIGEHCRLGERSTVKRSVVGAHVIIGANVKISNSVVLDNCVVEDGVKLDGCVVGSKVVVKEKSSLKACEVASQFVVEMGSSAKGEVLGASRELQNMFE